VSQQRLVYGQPALYVETARARVACRRWSRPGRPAVSDLELLDAFG
jgi:hypothetical protein